jgi:predicted RNase H-like HicB family nuclease
MRYAIVIEKGESNHSAYVPDLPGCVTTGATIPEVYQMMREAIEGHLAAMKHHGEATPAPTSEVGYVEIDLARVEAIASEEMGLSR